VFVGRQAEMDQLKATLEDVLGGKGRLEALEMPRYSASPHSADSLPVTCLRGPLVPARHCASASS